jgi:transposase InsO family protein
VDIIGPWKLSRVGNKYIVVLTDSFTRYAVSIPVPEKTVEVVARVLVERIFCYFGIPSVIHTDQGQPFTSQTMSMVSKVLGTKQAFSMPYNAQGHGVVERFNKTLCKMIRAYVDQETHNDWDEFIPCVTYAYIASIHAVWEEASFYLMFGREAILPADLRAGLNSDDIYAAAHPNDTFNHVQVLLDEEEERFQLTPPSVDYYPKSPGEIRIMTPHNKHLKSLYRSVRELYCKYPIDKSSILSFCQK